MQPQTWCRLSFLLIALLAGQLAPIFHEPSTAAADLSAVAPRAPSSPLDVVSTTPARPSGPRAAPQRHLVALATNTHEICGLAAQSTSPPARVPALLTHTAETPPQSPPATLADLAWLSGHWRGQGLGGCNEEAWTGAAGGQMLGMYRLLKNDQLSFMELLTLSEEKGSVVLRLKHFNPDLSGWEAQQDSIVFPLLQIEPGAAWFDGYSMFEVDAGQMQVWVRIGGVGERPERQVRIDYHRIDPRQSGSGC